MLKAKNVDVTGGPLFKSIILYSLPIMVGSLIQVLFNAADIVVLGNMADKLAVASVGVTAPIVGLVVNSFIGLSGGTNIILARYIGENNESRIRKTVDTSIISSVAVGILLAVIGIIFADDFLILIDCPAECFEGAKIYLELYFLAIPAIMVYNFGAAIIRVNGDSQTPLYYLIACGILNIVLNVMLCFVLEQKVIAVAVATLASQVLGAILVLIHLARLDNSCKLNFKRPEIDIKILGKIFRYGIPCAFTTALYCISNLQIQSAINAYGPDAIAGNTAAANVESLVASFTGAFGVAALAFVGQNVGANERERVKKSIRICLIIGFTLGLVLGVGLYLLGRPVLSLFVPGENAAIEYGLVRMRYILLIYFIAAINQVLTNAVQAFGYSFIPFCTSIITVLLFRVFWMSFIYPLSVTIHNLYFCYTCSWTLALIAHICTFLYVYGRYRKGKIVSI